MSTKRQAQPGPPIADRERSIYAKEAGRSGLELAVGGITKDTLAGGMPLAHPTARLLRQSAVRQVQRSSGNAAAQRNIAALIAPLAADTMAQRQAAVEHEAAPDAAPSTADDAFVNSTIDSFQDDELRKQIGPKLEDRRDFLEGMQQYLGPLEKVIEHFRAVRPVKAKAGSISLHERAASRLELVQNELGDAMPDTSVGLGLRGRYRPHDRHSNSKMAHPCGYAIDYRAESNPMITDPRLVKLLELQTGGATHFDQERLGVDRAERRALIRQMGDRAAHDPAAAPSAKEQAFFERFESEYQRVAAASQKFMTDLPATLQELKTTHQRLQAIEKQLKDQRKKKNKKAVADADQGQQQLLAEKAELEQKLAALKADLPKLFKPWLDKIQAEMKRVEKEVSDITLATLPTKGDLTKQERGAKARYTAASKQRKRAEQALKRLQAKIESEQKRKAPRERSIAQWTAELEAAHAELSKQTAQETAAGEKLQQLKHLRDALPKKAEWDVLRSLYQALSADQSFVFKGESTVKNPSVLQLIEKGFFTPDKEPQPGEKHDRSKHGFNLAFMKLMAKYGFDQGISWSPGSTDPMHFELVEGVDSILAAPKQDKQKAGKR